MAQKSGWYEVPGMLPHINRLTKETMLSHVWTIDGPPEPRGLPVARIHAFLSEEGKTILITEFPDERFEVFGALSDDESHVGLAKAVREHDYHPKES
jgi:hypothetical protein